MFVALAVVSAGCADEAKKNDDGLTPLPEPLDKPARPEPVNGWLCCGVTCLEPSNDLADLKKTLKEQA
jgi:hypothetical protein